MRVTTIATLKLLSPPTYGHFLIQCLENNLEEGTTMGKGLTSRFPKKRFPKKRQMRLAKKFILSF